MVCLCCGGDFASPLNAPVCARCVSEIKPAFPRPPKNVDALYCAGVFEGALRDLVHAYKYQGKEYLADCFFDLCLERWKMSPTQIRAVTAVPLPFWRSLKRGFNPPGLVAEKISKLWGVPYIKTALKRRIGFPSQTHLGRADRKRNAARSFKAAKGRRALVSGDILLIDDVFTTGATLSACAKLLKDMGFERVVGGVIAYDPLLPNRKLSDTIRAII